MAKAKKKLPSAKWAYAILSRFAREKGISNSEANRWLIATAWNRLGSSRKYAQSPKGKKLAKRLARPAKRKARRRAARLNPNGALRPMPAAAQATHATAQ